MAEEEGTTAGDAFQNSERTVVAALVNDEPRDLAFELQPGDMLEPIYADSPQGLAIIRHSAAHVLAQAVQNIFPGTLLGIGPPIADGFFYDFKPAEPFTPEDLQKIDKRMQEIVKQDQRFSRRVVTPDDAQKELADQPFKLELIDDKSDDEDNEVMEVGGAELTIYDNIDKKTGEVCWKDLCRGPHVPSTKYIRAFKVTRSSAAYWRGDARNVQLQRIYGTAWDSKETQKHYLDMLAEAEKRDHRKLGTELDLFSFPDEIGSGLPVFHPKGGRIRMIMEEYARKRHIEAGYEFVNTPHLTKSQLFETSGHLDWYAEGMYPPMTLDNDQKYYMKPMNCPMHTLIYRSRGRSFRELPLRLFEFGSVYRYEKSGVVHGLTRARGFTQDDAHIYCAKDQVAVELESLLVFVLDLLRDYGLTDFYLELSTKPETKSVGSDQEWDEATETLRQAALKMDLELVMDEGGGAFYGPKISVQAKDAIGRTWQLSTIQVDFQLPQRFDIHYMAHDGKLERPVMIHRALFGSIERFMAVLLEHFAGAMPPWLSPTQVVSIPIADEHVPYLEGIAEQLVDAGVRVEVDSSDERMQKKIRNAQKQKTPFMLIAGDEDRAANAVSFRYRDGTQKNGVPIAEAIAEIRKAIDDRIQV